LVLDETEQPDPYIRCTALRHTFDCLENEWILSAPHGAKNMVTPKQHTSNSCNGSLSDFMYQNELTQSKWKRFAIIPSCDNSRLFPNQTNNTIFDTLLLQKLTLWRPAAFKDFRKNTKTHVALCGNFSGPISATDPVRSKSSSLHSKKTFAWVVRILCEWHHKWRNFRPPWHTLPGPGHQP